MRTLVRVAGIWPQALGTSATEGTGNLRRIQRFNFQTLPFSILTFHSRCRLLRRPAGANRPCQSQIIKSKHLDRCT